MSRIPGYCRAKGCERPASRTGYCASHDAVERAEKRDKTKPVKKSVPIRKSVAPIKKVSTKRKDQNAQYEKLRAEYLKAHPICEVCGGEAATEVHHKKGRTNDLLCEVQYFLAVDRDCHRHLTEDSAFAIAQGYSINRNV